MARGYIYQSRATEMEINPRGSRGAMGYIAGIAAVETLLRAATDNPRVVPYRFQPGSRANAINQSHKAISRFLLLIRAAACAELYSCTAARFSARDGFLPFLH